MGTSTGIPKIRQGPLTSYVVFFILLCGLLLRLYTINHYDLWFDELGSSMYTSQNLDRLSRLSGTSAAALMLDQMKNDPHPSLYYFLVYLYSMTGAEDKALRLLSVIFSMLSLFIFYKLVRLLFQHRAAIYALAVMACNPFHIWYAQEARTYALACFLALLMVYVYLKALKHPTPLHWIAFPVTGFLAVSANYHAAFLLIATTAALFFRDNRRHAWKWFLSVFIIFMGFLLIKPILSGQLDFIRRSGFWILPPSPRAPLSTWMVFNLGYTYTTAAVPYWAGFALFSILFLYGVYFSCKTGRDNTLILLVMLFLPIGISYIFSKRVVAVYLNRQLLIFSPFCYFFIARGIEAIRNKAAKTAGIIGIIVLTAISLANYYRGLMPATVRKRPESHLGVLPKKNYTPLMAFLDKEFHDGDMIAVTDIQSYIITLSHIIRHPRRDSYDPSKIFRLLCYPIHLTPFDNHYLRIEDLIKNFTLEDGKQLHLITFFHQGRPKIEKAFLEQGPFRRVWLISASWDDQTLFPKNVEKMRDYMKKRWELVSSKRKDGVYVELYLLEDACRE